MMSSIFHMQHWDLQIHICTFLWIRNVNLCPLTIEFFVSLKLLHLLPSFWPPSPGYPFHSEPKIPPRLSGHSQFKLRFLSTAAILPSLTELSEFMVTNQMTILLYLHQNNSILTLYTKECLANTTYRHWLFVPPQFFVIWIHLDCLKPH